MKLMLEQSRSREDIGPLRLGLRGRWVKRFGGYPVELTGQPFQPRRAL